MHTNYPSKYDTLILKEFHYKFILSAILAEGKAVSTHVFVYVYKGHADNAYEDFYYKAYLCILYQI